MLVCIWIPPTDQNAVVYPTSHMMTTGDGHWLPQKKSKVCVKQLYCIYTTFTLHIHCYFFCHEKIISTDKGIHLSHYFNHHMATICWCMYTFSPHSHQHINNINLFVFSKGWKNIRSCLFARVFSPDKRFSTRILSLLALRTVHMWRHVCTRGLWGVSPKTTHSHSLSLYFLHLAFV